MYYKEGKHTVTLIHQDYLENRKLYNSIEEELRAELEKSIPIEHVGSTAIPDMCGKNIIDILIGAKDVKQFEEITNFLKGKRFIASQKSEDGIYQFFSSKPFETGSGDIHIHLVILNTERYSEFIILKEYLLQNKNEALNYSDFKKEIISKGITERREYKAVKSKYVANLISKAKEWYNKNVKS